MIPVDQMSPSYKRLKDPLSSASSNQPIFAMGALWTQLFPPVPTFTDRDLGSQTGRVFIVTGGNNGIGFELVKVLHAKGGTVYVAGRSPTKIADAITRIENENLGSKTKGQLRSLIIDLADPTALGPT